MSKLYGSDLSCNVVEVAGDASTKEAYVSPMLDIIPVESTAKNGGAGEFATVS